MMNVNGTTLAAASAPILEAEGLSAGYGLSTVVHSIDIVVHPGEVVALLGPNGAGRTTTLLALCGELQPRGGVVHWRGRPTTAPMHARVRDGLGVVTEDRCVLRSLTVANNLRVARSDVGLVLDIFPELTEHLHRRVGLLSGGQQQMVALGRALGRRPDVLLIDELSLGLAPQLVDRLLVAIRGAASRGIGVLVVEQHIRTILDVADRGYVMQRGRVALAGTASWLRDRIDDVESSYLAADEL